MWHQSINPFHNIIVSALVAAIPIAVLFGLLISRRVGGHIAAVCTLFVALTVAILGGPRSGMEKRQRSLAGDPRNFGFVYVNHVSGRHLSGTFSAKHTFSNRFARLSGSLPPFWEACDHLEISGRSQIRRRCGRRFLTAWACSQSYAFCHSCKHTLSGQ